MTASDEITKKIEVQPFITHLERMNRLESYLSWANLAIRRIEGHLQVANNDLVDCREHILAAMRAFEALKE